MKLQTRLEVFDFQPFTLFARVFGYNRVFEYSCKGNPNIVKAIFVLSIVAPISGLLNVLHHIIKDKVADFV